MVDRTPAEDLPELYRRILDAVAELEAAGLRAEAVRVRRAAIEAYSGAWDARAEGALESLLARARRALDGSDGARRRAAAGMLRSLTGR
jgi:hypothetical protein